MRRVAAPFLALFLAVAALPGLASASPARVEIAGDHAAWMSLKLAPTSAHVTVDITWTATLTTKRVEAAFFNYDVSLHYAGGFQLIGRGYATGPEITVHTDTPAGGASQHVTAYGSTREGTGSIRLDYTNGVPTTARVLAMVAGDATNVRIVLQSDDGAAVLANASGTDAWLVGIEEFEGTVVSARPGADAALAAFNDASPFGIYGPGAGAVEIARNAHTTLTMTRGLFGLYDADAIGDQTLTHTGPAGTTRSCVCTLMPFDVRDGGAGAHTFAITGAGEGAIGDAHVFVADATIFA